MENKMKTFRFDDVCINADMGLINIMTDYLFDKFPDCEVMYGVSPIVCKIPSRNSKERQRVFPKEYNAYSDYTLFYSVNNVGIPEMDSRAKLAGHGIVHVDHRLLPFAAQEMSICVSCSLVEASIFIPPFNKWNADTESVCKKHGIQLVKFEDGWLSMEHNKYEPEHNLWYLHAREFTMEEFIKWFEA